MSSLQSINTFVHAFAPKFTGPSFKNFSYLLLAWITTPFSHTVTGLLRAPLVTHADGRRRHFSAFHRFFSRARWELDDLGRVLVRLIEASIPECVTLIVDDTLCRRGGPRILGAGMFMDPLTSSVSNGRNRRKTFTFGLNFVVLSIWIPASFCHSGGIAIPLLFRLYRSKRTCPERLYRKRTTLAVELIAIAARWLEGRKITVIADSEYACRTLLEGMGSGIEMVGPLPAKAQLHNPKIVNKRGGRPRLWGERLLRPRELAAQSRIPWRKVKVSLYGAPVTVLVKTLEAVWKSAGRRRVLRVVITRDPRGRLDDGFFFSTQSRASVEEVLQTYARRWELEVCFRNVKQELGLEDVANGFTRKKKRGCKRAGPQADKRRPPVASMRTAPFAFIAYGVVVAWYLRNGSAGKDIARARRRMPWYRHKRSVSFSDMRVAFKREYLVEYFPGIQQRCAFANIPLDALPDWLMAA